MNTHNAPWLQALPHTLAAFMAIIAGQSPSNDHKHVQHRKVQRPISRAHYMAGRLFALLLRYTATR